MAIDFVELEVAVSAIEVRVGDVAQLVLWEVNRVVATLAVRSE